MVPITETEQFENCWINTVQRPSYLQLLMSSVRYDSMPNGWIVEEELLFGNGALDKGKSTSFYEDYVLYGVKDHPSVGKTQLLNKPVTMVDEVRQTEKPVCSSSNCLFNSVPSANYDSNIPNQVLHEFDFDLNEDYSQNFNKNHIGPSTPNEQERKTVQNWHRSNSRIRTDQESAGLVPATRVEESSGIGLQPYPKCKRMRRSESQTRLDWLPEGWEIEQKERKNGASAGNFDKYYVEPAQEGRRRRKFRSKNEVLEFLETGRRRPLTSTKRKANVEKQGLPSSTSNASEAILAFLMGRRM
ncbi:hypothetical protein C5167_002953 [Papaver somniferum]|uniref:MBD domain-containing protein n=1 Tax=Papaver somniferum TaxID=3469 RepID=A0A4Y7KZP2_PAPSO|nr:uncharacterized protein LOC113314107 [Papaver somniferum]RZC78764.1 hypothetical protein C5167_002953 [Papaver somniferum]